MALVQQTGRMETISTPGYGYPFIVSVCCMDCGWATGEFDIHLGEGRHQRALNHQCDDGTED